VASSGLPLTEGRTGGQETQLRRVKWLLLTAVILLAAFFRLYRIDSLPPGDGYDPAYYGVDALQFLRGVRPSVMLPPNREPLFSHLVTVNFLLFGASATTIHLTSALVGLLTVPLVCLAADALFATEDEEEPLRRWGGLMAALMVAISYWHLNWSRYGVRAILVPLSAAATFTFLWRGFRTGALAPLLFCGISLGLSMYTYQAARLLPVLVILGFVTVVWERGTITKRDWLHFILVVGVAMSVFAPLGLHFATDPSSFSHRIEEALVVQEERSTTSNLRAVLDQTVEALLAFTFAGDRTPYSTIPGRPSLNPFFSALFLLGIGISLTHLRKPRYVFLLSSLVVMTIPAMLAGKGPTAKRAIGTLPAVAMLVAVGALTPLVTLRRWLGDRLPAWANRLSAAWGVVVLCGFAYSGVITYRDYFIRWASNPNLPTHFEAGISAMGDFIGDLPPKEQVYTSPEPPSHPAMRFHSGLRDDVRGYNGRVCLVVPRTTTADTTYVIVPGKDDNSLDLLQRIFPQGAVTHRQSVVGDQPYFLAYRIPTGIPADLEPTRRLAARWSDRIQLLGFDLDQDTYYRPGQTVELTLYYQDLEPMEERYTAFVHLLGPDNPATGSPLWAQNDSEPCYGFYPTTSWHQGEVLLDRTDFAIPDDAPSGTYRLGTGFYDVVTQKRLPVASETAPTDHDVLILAEIPVSAP
jgi:hypothetical protein